jgi:dTDP-4-amino-4,6-dideoxygalactose transaminase
MIPISSVDIPEEAVDLVVDVLRSGRLAQGPMVAELERLFGEAIDVSNVIAVNNGTTALVAALQALGIGPGDEVITSPFTFAATLNAILEVGATARFADISVEDFCVDPNSMESLITNSTQVLMPVHLYGQCADMAAINVLARKYSARVVEDAAQAHGARVGGRAAGAWGVGCFSLYGTKNITTGEGGLITTDDDLLAERLRVLRNQGMRNRYEYVVPGHNYRMTDVHAAIGIPQVRRMTEIIAARRRNARKLTEALTGCERVRLPRELPGREHVWHQYTVLLDPERGPTRDDFVDRMAAEGVGTGVYYPRLVFDYDCYRNHPKVHADDSALPVATMVARRAVSLPVHPALTDSDLEQIVSAVLAALDG